MDGPSESLSEFYETHHSTARNHGDFIFVPERMHNRLAFLRGRPPDDDPTHLHTFSPAAVAALLEPFADVEIGFFGGRFIRLHRRLLSWDIAFRAIRGS